MYRCASTKYQSIVGKTLFPLRLGEILAKIIDSGFAVIFIIFKRCPKMGIGGNRSGRKACEGVRGAKRSWQDDPFIDKVNTLPAPGNLISESSKNPRSMNASSPYI